MGTAEWIALIVAGIAFAGSGVNAAMTYRLARLQHGDRLQDRRAADRRAAAELSETERRERRSQAVEIYLRAAGMVVSKDEREVRAGVAALRGLLAGNLLDDDIKVLVDTALSNAYAFPAQEITAAAQGRETVVVQGRADAPELDIEAGPMSDLDLSRSPRLDAE